MNIRAILILSALLLSATACEKQVVETKDDQYLPNTLEGKLEAYQDRLCFESNNGMLVKKDASGTTFSCEQAALNGDVDAQFSIGVLSEKRNDYKEAEKWYKLAAENGHRMSMLILSAKYLDGNGVPQDLISAHLWANRAARSAEFEPSPDFDESEKQKYLDNNEYLRKGMIELIRSIEAKMNAGQIAEARKLSE